MPFDDSLRKEIVNQADIVKVISSFLNVTKKGRNYVAVCPFHDDTNPSLSISPEKKMFKCFVCGTGGDVITFVQKYLHISYFEAMKKVAEIIGFHDPRLEAHVTVKNVDKTKETLLKCLKDLTLYYEYALNTAEGKEGLEYFNSRNIDAEMRSKYHLGYAFKDGTATIKFLQSKGHSLKTIEDIGITYVGGGVISDSNHGRVMFPICDKDGNFIGYSARRLLESEESKYINSPETYVFHKSSVLYNFHIAKEKARNANCVYVCEGFMDVFALSKIGIDNAVAIMGTALTQEHIAMLRSLNVEIRLCLDGDLPGQSAMMTASKLLDAAGLKFVVIDNRNSTKDPDEILQQDGPEALKKYLSTFLNRMDFTLNYYTNSNPLENDDQKKQLIKDFLPALSRMSHDQLILDKYVKKLSTITGYPDSSIKELVKQFKNAKTDSEIFETMNSYHPERKFLRRLALAERELLYQMVNNPKATKFYGEKVGNFYDTIYRQVANYLLEYAKINENFDALDVISSLQASELDNKDELINQLTTLIYEKKYPKECTDDLLNDLLVSISEEKNRITKKDRLNESLKGKDDLEKARILAEYNRKKILK